MLKIEDLTVEQLLDFYNVSLFDEAEKLLQSLGLELKERKKDDS